MTLDAIDGKQARRTGSSSALGELFDHGCDAISCRIFHFLIVSSRHASSN
jgi:ethanolaminephosphotransferase